MINPALRNYGIPAFADLPLSPERFGRIVSRP